MREAPGTFQMAETEPPLPDLILLIKPEPKFRVFLQNFRDLFRRRQSAPIESAPAAFWPDVFVDRGLPWRRFLQSGFYHVLALAVIWAGSRFLALQPHSLPEPRFNHAEVIYYAPAEYLPPLDTRRSTPAHARKADPEYSSQPIISVPPEATNRSQTIVSAPNVQLQQDVALPNVVSLLEKIPADTRMPIGPAPAVPASEISRLAPPMERAVIAPPPSVEAGSALRLGDINIGHSAVIAPAPQLSLDEQRAVPARNSRALTSPARSPQVIAPPPALAASGRSGARRPSAEMIALNLHPAVGAPPVAPPGNRRGSFAATPEGHRGASGAPGTSVGSGKSDASAAGKNSGSLPSGLYVGADPAARNTSAYSVNPNLIAGMRAPRLPARSLQSQGESKLSDEERAIFGDRKFYSLSLNMPNLNSAGGSWIIRFAALKPESASANPSSSAAAGNRSSGNPSSADASSSDLSAPAAKRKVDPAYPLELMRQNVSGTVILYAVIHSDGTVGSVRVLRSVDERIDRFASDAIVKWVFQPAMKNGSPVDVEATFWIPFHPAKVPSNF